MTPEQEIGWLKHAQKLWIEERAELHAEVKRLEGLVKRVEWVGGGSTYGHYCPFCLGVKHEIWGYTGPAGHTETCPAFGKALDS